MRHTVFLIIYFRIYSNETEDDLYEVVSRILDSIPHNKLLLSFIDE